MVDRDKIEKRKKGKKKKKKKKKPKNKKRSSNSGGGSPSPNSGSDDLEIESKGDTYGDKMDQLKKSKGISSSSSGSGDGIPRNDVSKVLEAVANMLIYAEGNMRASEDPETKRESVENDVMEVIYEQYTEFIADNGVQLICEKRGVDWQGDVIKKVIQDQDFSGDAKKNFDRSNTVVNLGGGQSFTKDEFHNLLMTCGHMLMFCKTLEKDLSNYDNKKEKIGHGVAKDMASKCIDFIGSFNVKSAAEDNGIKWERDVIQRIAKQG
jgi:hypothetical protein